MKREAVSFLVLIVVAGCLVATQYRSLPDLTLLLKANIPARGEEGQAADLQDPGNYIALWNLLSDVKNNWLYSLSILKDNTEINKTKVLNQAYISMQRSIENLMQTSESVRREKLKNLTAFVQQNIFHLQHPRNCNFSRLLICRIKYRCGFGCYTHYITSCFIRAFESQRVMIYKVKEFAYDNNGWEATFLSLSNCTWDGDFVDLPDIDEADYSERVVTMEPNHLTNLSAWMIPSELAIDLLPIHGDPFAWWLSQFSYYSTRMNSVLLATLEAKQKKLQFANPIVGIHIRRGDKLAKEANYYSTEEYMFFAKLWFDKLEMDHKIPLRTIYVATEDQTVLPELQRKYPSYRFLVNRSPFRVMGLAGRYTIGGLEAIVTDIYFLSQCEYVVCTLSSNACQVVYELMMHQQVDASLRIQSLDMPYRFKTSGVSKWKAIINHLPGNKDEMELRKGDDLSVRISSHSHYNSGFINGTNLRTGKSGWFPSFKARSSVSQYNYNILSNL